MLLPEPPPDAIPDTEVEAREELAGACCRSGVVAPTPQDGIELLEKVRQGPGGRRPIGDLFSPRTEGPPALAFGIFDSRHEAEPGMPFVAHPVTEEREASVRSETRVLSTDSSRLMVSCK